MIKYKPTRRGVFAKRQSEPTYRLAMTMTGHTVTVTTANPNMTDQQIKSIAMAWYPNATNVKIER